MPINKFGDAGEDSAIFTTNTSSSIGVTMAQINNVFLRRDGANNATGELNMSANKVINIATLNTPGDAASKGYVDSSTVSKTGDTMTGNLILQVSNKPSISLGCNDLRNSKRFNLLLGTTSDMIHNQIGQSLMLQSSNGILLRVADDDAATYGPSNVAFHKDIDMNEGLITNLRSPENDNDAASKRYVDSLIGTTSPHITSTLTMTSNNTTINGLTYITTASAIFIKNPHYRKHR
jgi:hypothetical protein